MLIHKKIRFLPESPRWLLLHKKMEKAVAIFERIAKSNKKDLNSCQNLNRLRNNRHEMKKMSVSTVEASFEKNDLEDNKTTIKSSKYVNLF